MAITVERDVMLATQADIRCQGGILFRLKRIELELSLEATMPAHEGYMFPRVAIWEFEGDTPILESEGSSEHRVYMSQLSGLCVPAKEIVSVGEGAVTWQAALIKALLEESEPGNEHLSGVPNCKIEVRLSEDAERLIIHVRLGNPQYGCNWEFSFPYQESSVQQLFIRSS